MRNLPDTNSGTDVPQRRAINGPKKVLGSEPLPRLGLGNAVLFGEGFNAQGNIEGVIKHTIGGQKNGGVNRLPLGIAHSPIGGVHGPQPLGYGLGRLIMGDRFCLFAAAIRESRSQS
jgi:hypothetical protein